MDHTPRRPENIREEMVAQSSRYPRETRFYSMYHDVGRAERAVRENIAENRTAIEVWAANARDGQIAGFSSVRKAADYGYVLDRRTQEFARASSSNVVVIANRGSWHLYTTYPVHD